MSGNYGPKKVNLGFVDWVPECADDSDFKKAVDLIKTNEEINRKIAEAIGWRLDRHSPWWTDPNGNAKPSISIPDYCSDLNAMAEAENKLTFDQCFDFDKHLAELPELAFTWKATAMQRALAFLKTVAPKL